MVDLATPGGDRMKLAYCESRQMFVGMDCWTNDVNKAIWYRKPKAGYMMVSFEEAKLLPVKGKSINKEDKNGNSDSV